MTSISCRTAAAFALACVVAATPAIAGADEVDQALATLPDGPISCEQATKYWSNEADYNDMVSKANLLARIDPRGPEIREALARVDEAANRCGLKGGGAPTPTPVPVGNAPAPKPIGNAPAPPPADAINSSAPGLPTINIQLPGGQWLTLPNLQQIVADFLAKYGIRI